MDSGGLRSWRESERRVVEIAVIARGIKSRALGAVTLDAERTYYVNTLGLTSGLRAGGPSYRVLADSVDGHRALVLLGPHIYWRTFADGVERTTRDGAAAETICSTG